MATPPTTPAAALSIESIVAVDAPRDYRVHPRDRVVAYTAEAAGARQLFTLSLRGGYPNQLTASDKNVSDPAVVARRPPPGVRARRRDLGHRSRRIAPDPGGRQARWRSRAALVARRPPDRIHVAPARLVAGVADRCPGAAPRPPGQRPEAAASDALTATGVDVEAFEWSPDGAHIAIMTFEPEDETETAQISIVDVATGASRVVAGEHSHDTAARWLPDGSLLHISDADGWFQVVRLTADGHDRIVLTGGEREHGEPVGGFETSPLPSPDGARFVHVEIHDGLQDLVVRDLSGATPPKRGRGRPPKTPRTVAVVAAGPGSGSIHGTASGVRSAGWPTVPGWWLSGSARLRPGPVAAPGAGCRTRGLATAPGDRFDAGRAPPGAQPGACGGRGTDRVHGA